MFPCLIVSSLFTIFITTLVLIELNDISEAASFIPEEPTEGSVKELPYMYQRLYSEELSAIVSNKVQYESDKSEWNRGNVNTMSPGVDDDKRDEDNMHKKLRTYFATTVTINVLCILVFSMLLCKLWCKCCEKYIVKASNHSFSVSDFLIITTCSAVIGYLSMCIAGVMYCMCDHSVCGHFFSGYYRLQLFDNITDLVQFSLQGIVLLLVERREFHGYVRNEDEGCCRNEHKGCCKICCKIFCKIRCKICCKIPCKILPGLLLFLFAINALRWGADSFYEMKSENDVGFFQTQSTIYGKSTWQLIRHTFYPLAVFFRFHSAVVFLKAFYHTWLDRLHR